MVTILSLLVLTIPVFATVTITTSDNTPEVGSTITVSGHCDPGVVPNTAVPFSITATFNGQTQQIRTGVTDRNGNFTHDIRIQPEWENFIIDIEVTCESSTHGTAIVGLQVPRTPSTPPTPPTPPAPPPGKPSLGNDVGKNAFLGAVGGGAANAVCGVGELTLGAGIVASGLAVVAAGLIGTFVWNVGENLFDPPYIGYFLETGEALATVVLLSVFYALAIAMGLLGHKRRYLATLALNLIAFCILAYIPEVILERAPLFYLMPFILVGIAAATVRIGNQRQQNKLQQIIHLLITVIVASIGFGFIATIVSYSSGWIILRDYSLVVLVGFGIGAFIIEQALYPGAWLRKNP